MESLPYRTQLSPPLLSHAATLMLLCAVTFSSFISLITTRQRPAGGLFAREWAVRAAPEPLLHS